MAADLVVEDRSKFQPSPETTEDLSKPLYLRNLLKIGQMIARNVGQTQMSHLHAPITAEETWDGLINLQGWGNEISLKKYLKEVSDQQDSSHCAAQIILHSDSTIEGYVDPRDYPEALQIIERAPDLSHAGNYIEFNQPLHEVDGNTQTFLDQFTTEALQKLTGYFADKQALPALDKPNP